MSLRLVIKMRFIVFFLCDAISFELFTQVETLSANETVKIPIAVLKVGESRVVQPELEFPYGPVTFTLIEGNGPIYIHGQQVPNGYEDQVIEGGEEFDSDEELVIIIILS